MAEASLGDGVGRSAPFPVVGVGASAGGLEAFSQMLRHLPTDSGMGFVLISHLDPDHESSLVDILSRTTSLPVVEISAGLQVEPNHVYVLPPGKTVGIEQGVLKLRKRSKSRVPHRPIDSFFESLSQDQGELAIGVVLSGTATDGTMGLESIKAEGGITFAQDDSARHSSMPRSAIAAGCVDLVLSPADIAAELTRIAKHPQILRRDLRGIAARTGASLDGQSLSDGASPGASNGRPVATAAAAADDEAGGWRGVEKGYEEVLSLLHQSSGVSFSLYKPSTIRRRINRRMILTKHVTLAEYAEFVRDHSSERERLYSDLLINVTSFFRNPETFDALRLEVLPELIKRRGDDPIRCWVIGCSTGQEAYSIAMSFAEAADESQRRPHVQIFATDVNEASLDEARLGLYSKTITADLSPERLRRFFVEEQGGYRVVKSLRETVVFARHDLISDPPFSRLDLISCRNVLIYLQPSVQQRAIPTFHYSLKPGGVLVLGASESIGRYTDLFSSVAKKRRIFTRKPGPTRALHLPIGLGARSGLVPNGDSVSAGRPESQASGHGELDAQREADRVTINRYGPSGVVIDSELQILQFRGATGAFLEPPIGKASFDVLKMAKEGLMLPLRAAISQAKKTDATAHRENVRFQSSDSAGIVNLEVIPLGTREERYFLILFQEPRATGVTTRPAAVDDSPVAAARRRRPKDEPPAGRIANLEAELADMREYLRSVQEQHATDHEELQTVNEEAQSANEELQSLNEELETSKEEIESINEELNTVNEEMNARNLELKRLNNDLLNLQLSTKLAILVLKRDLTLRDFSPQASAQFDLYRGDVGRPISLDRLGLELTDGTPPLEHIAAAILEDLHEREHEVRDRDGQWHLMRVRPYVTMEGQVDGVVVVLIAIDALKRSEQAARHSVGELATANRIMNEFVASLAHELRGPLAPIVNALSLMRQSPADASWSQGTQEMLERQVEHMVHLLDDLLDASRVSRGTIEIRPRQIDLMSAVQIALDDARPTCARKGVEIVVALPSEPIICNADPTRIAQVVSNLLNNACKFTDRGGRVDFSVVREHDRAVITVRDTGIGIAAEQLPHIFELFMQVGSPLERGDGGLGIGLTLVKDLVERHGGTVEARSEGPGRGSEFEVHLPLYREVAKAKGERGGPGEADRSRATTVLKGRRILVVDDNRDSAESMACLLELAGNETLTAHEGVSALKAAAAFRPDVMLLDVGLPGLNGHEVARRIRAESWGADVTLVAVTGWGRDEDKRKSRDAGFDAHVVKPVGQAELMRVIAEHHHAPSAGP